MQYSILEISVQSLEWILYSHDSKIAVEVRFVLYIYLHYSHVLAYVRLRNIDRSSTFSSNREIKLLHRNLLSIIEMLSIKRYGIPWSIDRARSTQFRSSFCAFSVGLTIHFCDVLFVWLLSLFGLSVTQRERRSTRAWLNAGVFAKVFEGICIFVPRYRLFPWSSSDKD